MGTLFGHFRALWNKNLLKAQAVSFNDSGANKNSPVTETPLHKTFEEAYEIKQKLGEGHFGKSQYDLEKMYQKECYRRSVQSPLSRRQKIIRSKESQREV